MVSEDLRNEFRPEDRTFSSMLRRQTRKHGERTLFACGDVRISYDGMRDVAARYAGKLSEAGVAKGDRVAIMASNRPEFMKAFVACGWRGAVSVPINVASRGFQLQHILSNSGARLLIIEAGILAALYDLEFQSLQLETIWVIGDHDGAFPSHGPRVLPFPQGSDPIKPTEVQPHDPLTILYTSGTTGLSKGVVCPHAQFFWWAYYTGTQLGVVQQDVLHTPLPLFHTNALNCFFQALLFGATQVVEPRFSVSNFWTSMTASGATVTYLLGAMVPMLLSREPGEEEREHSIRVALSPGVPASAAEAFTGRTGIVLLEGYGATESNAVIGADSETVRHGWAGRLREGFEARIVDEFDNPLADGEAGELVLRAAEPFSMALGYFGMPEKTLESWRNLWLHTGDRMVRDADGYYRFIDRMKDSIRRRGENISSYEVEQVLIAHPDVEMAAVFPVASDLAEDEVMAAIVPARGANLTGEDLVRHCEGKMSYFAVPRYFDFVDSLPRTENGKVQKFKLRDRGLTQATWDREAAGITLKR
ncbi:ATP-dependent acyl-CoA ligase [Paracoccus versutus]|uniref:ATP-dependent acyl-CoA ligase n=1 Tax=Paracoccus versutus TaxID=34007 RepID=UPI001FB858B0|nr:ATP-dependent acyl-CoA ligase [Paracoccus versutus]MCJ1901688.1 ATP-dependent acyl-CoA ligase [Paracoccus versutus]